VLEMISDKQEGERREVL